MAGVVSRFHQLIRQHIQRLIDEDKSQVEIGEQCGLGQATIFNYLNSEPKPDLATIKKFSVGLGIPLDQLLADEPAPTHGKKSRFVLAFSKKPAQIPPSQIPVLGPGPCGKWRDLSDLEYPSGHADRYESAPTTDPNAFYVVAHGDSMIGDNIQDGDLLLVEPSKPVQDGKIVFARTSEGCTVKRFFRFSSHIELRPMNQEHKSLIIKDDAELRCYRITHIVKKV